MSLDRLCLSCSVSCCSDSGTGVVFFPFLGSPSPQRSELCVGCSMSFEGEPFSLKCWREGDRLASEGGRIQARYLELGKVR